MRVKRTNRYMYKKKGGHRFGLYQSEKGRHREIVPFLWGLLLCMEMK